MYKNRIIQEDLKKICDEYDFAWLKGKTVLVTGALGMLAYYYTAALLYLNDEKDYGIKVIALARKGEILEKEFGGRDDTTLLVQDVCEKIDVIQPVDVILHAAGRADPEAFKENPVGVIEANVKGTQNVLEFAKEKQARVIFISTREVYGAVAKSPVEETDAGVLNQTELRSCYPESKRMAENLIVSYAYQFGVEYEIARLAHAYGPMMKIKGDGRVMADLLGRAVREEDIVLKSTGEAKRAFCYVADAVAGLLLLTVSEDKNQIYNIANETEEISIRDLAESLANWYDLKFDIQLEEDDKAYVKFARTALDTGKIEKLGWKPLTRLEDGIKRTVEFFRG
ncbi:NAD-dependent epimerase/dehydratase family protein [Candidatus Saccharibacteria bacterium]|nr:NAD-dependent epimerase/dehydratase family protein [Candidatus Saccharibacteria bacterium]MBR3122195.1 NAD-dependent epimerase/dehydratase family protein [Candidatus Saccharibacteria bacterium]